MAQQTPKYKDGAYKLHYAQIDGEAAAGHYLVHIQDGQLLMLDADANYDYYEAKALEPKLSWAAFIKRHHGKTVLGPM